MMHRLFWCQLALNIDSGVCLYPDEGFYEHKWTNSPVGSIQHRLAVYQNEFLLQSSVELHTGLTVILWPLNSPNPNVLKEKHTEQTTIMEHKAAHYKSWVSVSGGGGVQPMRKVQLFHGKHVTVNNVYVAAGINFFQNDVLPARCCSTGNSNHLKEMKSFYVLQLSSGVVRDRNAAGAR